MLHREWESYFVRILLLIVLFVLPGLVFGQVYKWTDKEGNVHFGDSPPDDADTIQLNTARTPSPEQVQEAQSKFDKSVADRVDRDRKQVASDAQKVNPINTSAHYANWSPNCNAPIVRDKSATFDRKMISRLLKQLEGTWRGSAKHFNCDVAQGLSEKCRNLIRSNNSHGRERDKCLRSINLSADRGVIEWEGAGSIIAEWKEEMGGLYLQSVGERNIEDDHLENRYLGAYSEMRYMALPQNSKRDDAPSLEKVGASANLFNSSDECIGFVYSAGGGYTRRRGGSTFRRVGTSGAVQVCSIGNRLRLVLASSPTNAISFTMWEMKR
jgi:hypothetical protein